ncbi:MAG: cytochrome c oxidase subunit II [Actinomycetota bacterium]|nr:cytochrome c oxidase subunit II [Actinomycetota bacterium]
MLKKVLWVIGLLGLGLLLASCAPHATQDTLKPAGPNARDIKSLFVPVFWVAVAVFVIVEGGIVLIMIKFRHRKGRDAMPAQIHGNTKLELGWTIAPALVLAFVMVPTVGLLWKLAAPPPADALHVTVEGHQWWWGFRYTDPDMATSYDTKAPITVADVMVVPVGRPVYLDLESVGGLISGQTPAAADYEVIHSFWIPELAGKQDVVPQRTNHILLSADHAGMYTGQCAEFCGLQHGRMKVRVIALDQADWTAWVANQKGPAATPTADNLLAQQGMQLFMNPLSGDRGTCVTCHAIGGTDASSPAAPNLTHFADPNHSCFAGCDWDTTDEAALEAWLRDPNAVKLGSKMPNYHLSQDEINGLVAYLNGLK